MSCFKNNPSKYNIRTEKMTFLPNAFIKMRHEENLQSHWATYTLQKTPKLPSTFDFELVFDLLWLHWTLASPVLKTYRVLITCIVSPCIDCIALCSRSKNSLLLHSPHAEAMDPKAPLFPTFAFSFVSDLFSPKRCFRPRDKFPGA